MNDDDDDAELRVARAREERLYVAIEVALLAAPADDIDDPRWGVYLDLLWVLDGA